MKVVDEPTLRAAVAEAEALAAAETAFRALAQGRATQPAPLGMEIPAVEGEVHVKGAYLKGESTFAFKLATGFYRNPDRGLPTGSGLVLVLDARTGFPLALLEDDGYLTELRTAGAGALAVRQLAPEEIEAVAFVGAGTQARFQARALAGVRSWDETRVWGPHPEGREAYRREMAPELGHPVRTYELVEEAVDGADVVVTVTPSREPLVRADSLVPGATVIAVGADGPAKRELEPGVMGRADLVVVDSLKQCLELGELHHAVEAGAAAAADVHAELGRVVTGEAPGRTDRGQSIVCDLTGVGAQDAAIAALAWERVRAEVG